MLARLSARLCGRISSRLWDAYAARLRTVGWGATTCFGVWLKRSEGVVKGRDWLRCPLLLRSNRIKQKESKKRRRRASVSSKKCNTIIGTNASILA